MVIIKTIPIFDFDDSEDFDHNLTCFLDHMESIDSEMSAILRRNISQLKGGLDDAARRIARRQFNQAVKTDLDLM